MSEPARIRRTRILREAEGYLDLVTAFGERWPCREDYRQQLCSRVLEILARIDNPGGLAGEIAFLRGQALKAAGLYGEAVHALQAASELDPANVHVFLALAWCYKRSRRIDMAIQSLEAALEVEPDWRFCTTTSPATGASPVTPNTPVLSWRRPSNLSPIIAITSPRRLISIP
jgi:tetratricopeptide (TPR) repeat protein